MTLLRVFVVLTIFILTVSAEPKKVLFLENAGLEHAWTYRHDLGRASVAHTWSQEILTSVVVSDEFNDELTTSIVEKYIEDGYDLIFATSSGWIGASQKLALAHPGVHFVQNPGWNFTASDPRLTNLIGVDGQLYQGYYLAGILAGAMSVTGKIGYLNGQPGIPLTTNSMNSYCVGARSVNPAITCHVITLGDWTDPRKHKQASEQLLALGCDHLVSVTGSYVPDTIAKQHYQAGDLIYSCGFADDFRVKLGPSVTSSAVFFWDVPYDQIIRMHLTNTWVAGSMSPGMDTLAVDAAPPSHIVPTSILPLFQSERQRLINAPIGQEIVFCGDQALEGLPAGVPIDPITHCISQVSVSNMGYLMGYMEEIPGQFYFIDIYLLDTSAAYIALTVSISVCVLLSFIYSLLLLRYLKTPVIRYASPVFCLAIFVGAWMQFASAYIYLQKPTDANCMASVWLEMLGLTIMLSAICVKNYRMWRLISNAAKFAVVKISTTELMIVLTLALLGMSAIMIAWQVDEPYLATTKQETPPLEIDERYLFCGSTNIGLWIGLTWGYLCCWISFAVLMAYLTRRLQGVFNESSNIALAVYNIVVLELIFLPLIYTFNLDQFEGKTILLSLQPMYRAIATLSLIFVPKFWIAMRRPDLNTLPSQTSHRTTSPQRSEHIPSTLLTTSG